MAYSKFKKNVVQNKQQSLQPIPHNASYLFNGMFKKLSNNKNGATKFVQNEDFMNSSKTRIQLNDDGFMKKILRAANKCQLHYGLPQCGPKPSTHVHDELTTLWENVFSIFGKQTLSQIDDSIT